MALAGWIVTCQDKQIMEITTYDLYVSRTLGYNTPNTLSRDATSIWSINCCSSSVQPDRMLLPPRSRDTLIILAQLNQPVPVGVPSGWCRSALILRQKVAKATWWPGSASTGIFFPREATNSNALRACERPQFLVRDLRWFSVLKKPNNHPVSCSKFVTLGSNHLTFLYPRDPGKSSSNHTRNPSSAFVSGGGKGIQLHQLLPQKVFGYIYTIYKYNITG